MMCFTETWLSETVSDDFVSIDGFDVYWGGGGGGQNKGNWKEKGGGVCVYINRQLFHPKNVTMKFKLCSPANEVLLVYDLTTCHVNFPM